MKRKDRNFDEWVQEYLANPKNLLDLEKDSVRWRCPKCGQRWRIEVKRNEYIGVYEFNCTKCNAQSSSSCGDVKAFHYYMN